MELPSTRLLGIDAGGSGSRVVLVVAGEVTELPDGPPMNALLTNGFAKQLEKIIREVGATAVGIGMPGMRSPRHAKDVSRTLTQRCGCPVRVTGDGETAQLGAFGGGPGLVVIAGTGCAAVGRDGQRLVRAGGHGFLLGDEGSAYWLGQAAARAALYWEDGMGGSESIHLAERDRRDRPRTRVLGRPGDLRTRARRPSRRSRRSGSAGRAAPAFRAARDHP
jgi:N-acetylglucosamine kinase-like BadF-type ATPase